MQVEILVKVGGRVAETQVVEVSGTLEQMEETIHAMGKRASGEALQAAVAAVEGEVQRPLFRKRAEPCVTKDIKVAR